MALAACGGDDGASDEATGSPVGSEEASVPAWWDEDDGGHPDDEDAAEASEAEQGEPDGEEASSDDAEATGTDDTDVEVEKDDPCDLVTAEEWADWAGMDTTATPIPLEHGEACGWKNDDDTVRMAIAALRVTGSERFLLAEERRSADEVDGLGHPAFWLAGFPVDGSSTLVVETPELDLVIEMSTSDGGSSGSDLRSGAIAFAELALERV